MQTEINERERKKAIIKSYIGSSKCSNKLDSEIFIVKTRIEELRKNLFLVKSTPAQKQAEKKAKAKLDYLLGHKRQIDMRLDRDVKAFENLIRNTNTIEFNQIYAECVQRET